MFTMRNYRFFTLFLYLNSMRNGFVIPFWQLFNSLNTISYV